MKKPRRRRKTKLTLREEGWLKTFLTWRQDGIGWRALADAVDENPYITTPGEHFVRIARAQNLIRIRDGLAFPNSEE